MTVDLINTAKTALADLPLLHQNFLKQFINPEIVAEPGAQDSASGLGGFVGRAPNHKTDSVSIAASGVLGGPARPFRVVTFYTRHNDYAEHAKRLEGTLQQ